MKTQTEAKIQSECVVWFRNKYCLRTNNTRCAIFSVPNEIGMEIRGVMMQTRLPKKTIDSIIAVISQKMKNMGMMAGVSDTIAVLPNGKTLFIEFKTQTGYQSKAQQEFEQTIKNIDHEYHVIRSVEEFKQLINDKIG